MKSQIPDEVCEAYSSRKGIKAVISLEEDLVVIEGNKETLEFLGNLLLAQANCADCGFHLGPNRAGRHFFSKKSKLGLYIHRTPCGEKGPGKKTKTGS